MKFFLVFRAERLSLCTTSGCYCILDPDSLLEGGLTMCPKTPAEDEQNSVLYFHSVKTQELQSRRCFTTSFSQPRQSTPTQTRHEWRGYGPARELAFWILNYRECVIGKLGWSLLACVAPDPTLALNLYFNNYSVFPSICSQHGFLRDT